MRIARIDVRNFRRIKSRKSGFTCEFENFNVIIGRNDAGKSSLVEAIELLLTLETPDEEQFPQFDDEEGDITITGDFEEAENGMVEELPGDPPPDVDFRLRVVHESASARTPSKLYINGEEVERETEVDGHTGKGDIISYLQEKLPQPRRKDAERDFEDDARLARNKILNDLMSPVFDNSSRVERIEEDVEDLFKEANPYSEEAPEDEGVNYLAEQAEKISQTLSTQHSEISQVDIRIDEISLKDAVSLDIVVEDSVTGNEEPAGERGSGVGNLLILSMLKSVAEWEAEADNDQSDQFAILFEEPENSLHPDAVRNISQSLDDIAQEHNQVFVTTHSPILINTVTSRGGAIVFAQKNNNGVSKFDVIKDDTQNILNDLGARPSDLLLSDYIIYVEGPTDMAILNEIMLASDLEELNKDGVHHWRELNVTFHSGGGNALQYIVEQIPDINPNGGVLLDRDTISRTDLGNTAEQVLDELPEEVEAHVLDRQQIEDYVPIEVVRDYYEDSNSHISEPNDKDSMKDVIEDDHQYSVNDARQLAQCAREDHSAMPELQQEVIELINKIDSAN
jgi:putative ATP-dependent endonuclease of OLD family